MCVACSCQMSSARESLLVVRHAFGVGSEACATSKWRQAVSVCAWRLGGLVGERIPDPAQGRRVMPDTSSSGGFQVSLSAVKCMATLWLA